MKEERKSTGAQFPLIITAVVAIWLAGAALIHFGPVPGTLEQRGLFGDSFGAINALFAGFAFAGVIYAILLQREELRLQREELKLTRSELARTASAQEEISKSQSKQLKHDEQIARLTALSALLTWELNRPKEQGFFSGSPDPENVADRIRNILDALEPGFWR